MYIIIIVTIFFQSKVFTWEVMQYLANEDNDDKMKKRT